MSLPQENDEIAHLQVGQIDGLVAAAGVDGTRSILDAFWRSTTELLETLKDQVGQETLDLAAQTAHAVKGSAANVGAQRLAAAAFQVEDACHTGEKAAIDAALNAVLEDFEAVRECFEDHLSKAAS